MNDTTDMDNRHPDDIPSVDASEATLIPVVAPAEGEFVPAVTDPDDVTEGEVIGYIQTGEDLN